MVGQFLWEKEVHDLDSIMGLPTQEALDTAYERALQHGAIQKYADRVKGGKTGVIGILKNGDGPTTALRFDMDALGLEEVSTEDHFLNQLGFRSQNKNKMHACGHDGHVSIGLGLAKVLPKIKDKFCGEIKLIFQPGEEGVRGAKSIVDKGHLDDVDYILSCHIMNSNMEEGADFYPGSGKSMATTKLDAHFVGRSSHAAANPELGKNVSLGIATAILNLEAIPRHSGGSSRINVGIVVCGTGRNVIPDVGFIQLETRGETTEINDYVTRYAKEILKSSADMHGLEVKIVLMGGTGSFDSSRSLMDRAKKVGSEIGLKPTSDDWAQMSGSEDIAYMINRVQENGGEGTFVLLLTDMDAPIHNGDYDFDEQILKKGIHLYLAMIIDICK